MQNIFLTRYSVKGIKALDQLISLSFYKKTISKDPDTRGYNVKGIYGMNGSGKSGIVTSVEILRNLLTDPGYLNNPIAQKNLDAIINKGTHALFIETNFIVNFAEPALLFQYSVTLTKDLSGKYVLSHEKLAFKKASANSDTMEPLFEVINGEFTTILKEKEKAAMDFSSTFISKTVNLLETASACALFFEKFWLSTLQTLEASPSFLEIGLCLLYLFGNKIHVYLDQSDDHRTYVAQTSLKSFNDQENDKIEIDTLISSLQKMDNDSLNVFSVTDNPVSKAAFSDYERNVSKLYEFLHIFKSNLLGIEIDKRENRDFWVCNLIMVYDSYKIHAEYESTGIKKLIRLYAYLKDMVHGGIVFIDEFDSNLHDVYLCALLEYLMEYGEGQLCFTTHNVGPMDILKRNKKSIDFLSENHQIYPWTTNGNYSPSKLYRNGMIEGSPFNVDAIDFIGIFGSDGEDE